MAAYDTFVNNLSELQEDKELPLAVRDLQPGIHKYCYRHVVALVSSDPGKYPDKLDIRFSRGQLHPNSYSIKIVKQVPTLPAKYLD